jgi:hypothetical protein
MKTSTRKTLKLERIGDKVYVTADREMSILKYGGEWHIIVNINDNQVTYDGFATLADARLAGRTFYGM